jgi:hypothetical protein
MERKENNGNVSIRKSSILNRWKSGIMLLERQNSAKNQERNE